MGRTAGRTPGDVRQESNSLAADTRDRTGSAAGCRSGGAGHGPADDPAVRERAIKVLETYWLNFRDQSYFAAFARSGNYYFNDAANQFAGKQLRYTLSATNPNDKWFFSTLSSGKDYQVNVDPDVHLGVTKVWINVLIKQGSKVLGVIGTGIDITEFLRETVDINQPRVRNLFVDRDMAIQLYREASLIDYASITKDVKHRSKVDLLLTSPDDIENLRQAMRRLENSEKTVATLWVTFNGKKHLLGASYLPEIGWFDLTLIHPQTLFSSGALLFMPLLYGLALMLALLLVGWLVHRWILGPVSRLRTSMAEVQHGNYQIDLPVIGKGEISDLSRQFTDMVNVVRDTRTGLEDKVRQRTEELLRLTETDLLTGLFNRRGMQKRFNQELARQSRQKGALGLLLIDLDYFKQINDRYGHAAGDTALGAAATVIRESIRPFDHAARWGGRGIHGAADGMQRRCAARCGRTHTRGNRGAFHSIRQRDIQFYDQHRCVLRQCPGRPGGPAA
jgi:HAMP domain-containing protein